LIAEGQHLGYRRTEQGGTWVARYYTPEQGRRFHALGTADDTAGANGTHVLSFQEALKAAQDWFNVVMKADGAGVRIGPYTVADAAHDWLGKWKGSERSKATSDANVRHYILPALGKLELARLDRGTIETWLHDLATKPPVRIQDRMQSTTRRRSANAKTLQIGYSTIFRRS